MELNVLWVLSVLCIESHVSSLKVAEILQFQYLLVFLYLFSKFFGMEFAAFRTRIWASWSSSPFSIVKTEMQLCFLLSRNMLSINVPLLLHSLVGNLTAYVPLHVSLLCQALYIHLYHHKVQTVQMIDIVISRYYPAVLQIDLSCQMGNAMWNAIDCIYFKDFFHYPFSLTPLLDVSSLTNIHAFPFR